MVGACLPCQHFVFPCGAVRELEVSKRLIRKQADGVGRESAFFLTSSALTVCAPSGHGTAPGSSAALHLTARGLLCYCGRGRRAAPPPACPPLRFLRGSYGTASSPFLKIQTYSLEVSRHRFPLGLLPVFYCRDPQAFVY